MYSYLTRNINAWTYACDPGPREEVSWYVCVFRVENREENRSLAIGLRWVGAISSVVGVEEREMAAEGPVLS